MSEVVSEKYEFQELQGLEELVAKMQALTDQAEIEHRDPRLRRENEGKKLSIRRAFIHLTTEALKANPDQAREIVDIVSDLWTFGENYSRGDFRSEVFGNFMRQKMKEGLYRPQDDENWLQSDSINSMKFVERRMRIVKSLIDDGFTEFKPYLEFLKESRCKLKVRDMTFWMDDPKHEKNFLKNLGTGLNKDEFWRELITYIAQKSSEEIGGIDRVQGKNRNSGFVRFGNKIVHQVEAEAFKYDLHTVLFIALLERDLEVSDGQNLHYQHLGRWSRWRYTQQMCREAQRTYRPTIQKHNEEVAGKVARVIATNGESLIEGPEEDFAARIDAVMKQFPQYKYKEVEELREFPDEDVETHRCEIGDYEIVPDRIYEESGMKEMEYQEYAESCDTTSYEDPRAYRGDNTG